MTATCPNCGYEMINIAEPELCRDYYVICPQCGTEVEVEVSEDES